MAEDETVLRIDELSVAFIGDEERTLAVDALSLHVAAGETLGLVGESGCGKSTVALALLGLLPPAGRVLGGRAHFAGKDLLQMNNRALRSVRGKRIAMIFQDPMSSLNPYLRVATQLCEGMRLHLGLDRSAARARALELLRAVEIPEPERRIDRYPHEFSGGQRQRLMIAMALACEPELLIADEPTTALDVTVQAQILALLRRLQRERGLAMVLVTHDLGVVAGMSDRVAVMYAGRVVEAAPAEALFEHPRHPYTRGLLAAVPRVSGERIAELATIPGLPPRLSAPWKHCAFAERCPWRGQRCELETPELRAVDADHRHRCLFDIPGTDFPDVEDWDAEVADATLDGEP